MDSARTSSRTLSYAYLGTLGQLGLRLVRGKTDPHLSEYFVWGGGLLVSFVILLVLGRIALRLLEEAQKRQRLNWRTIESLATGRLTLEDP